MDSGIVGNSCPEQNAASRAQPQRLIPGSAPRNLAYSPYGYHSTVQTLLGFNGGRPDPVTGYYPLGNGRRAFSPSLMRFISSDSMSPFAAGGLNSYVYCLGDPVNRADPSGNFSLFRPIARLFRHFFPKKKPEAPGKLHLSPILEMETITKAYTNISSDTKIKVMDSAKSVPHGYVLRGLHGSPERHARSLLAGLNPGYAKEASYGKGFYASTNIGVASEYTGPDGSIFGAYVHKSARWVVGEDYYYANRNVMVIRESAYSKVLIRREVVFPILISNKASMTY